MNKWAAIFLCTLVVCCTADGQMDKWVKMEKAKLELQAQHPMQERER